MSDHSIQCLADKHSSWDPRAIERVTGHEHEELNFWREQLPCFKNRAKMKFATCHWGLSLKKHNSKIHGMHTDCAGIWISLLCQGLHLGQDATFTADERQKEV